MSQTKTTTLNCFSPPVMLATLVIEFSLAIYTLWRYRFNALTRLAVATFVMLATFQAAEYFVCTGSAGHVSSWSRLGFVAITTLPPLGIHLMYVLAGKPERKLVNFAYATMAAFIVYFTLYSQAFTGYECTGNYVIFQLHLKSGGTYAIYYYGWLLTGLGLGWHWLREKKLKTVRALMVGWLVFLLPTAISNTVRPGTAKAIPSVMCGFAVLFALILAFYIMPKAGTPRLDKTA